MGTSILITNRHVVELERRRHCTPDHVVLKAQLLKLREVADGRRDGALRRGRGLSQGTSNRLNCAGIHRTNPIRDSRHRDFVVEE